MAGNEVAPHINGPWNFQETVPEALKQRLRARMRQIAVGFRPRGTAAVGSHLQNCYEDAVRRRRRSVPEEYIPMILEEMMLDDNDPKTVHWRTRPDPETLASFRVVIIGAGVSGLSMAIKLQEAGIDFVIYEKNKTVGDLAGELVSRLRGRVHRTTFIRCRSNPTTIGRIIFETRRTVALYGTAGEIQYTISGSTFGLKLKLRGALRCGAIAVVGHYAEDASDAEATCVANAVVTAVRQLNRHFDSGVEWVRGI